MDFWKMLWHRCTLIREKNVNIRHLYLCVRRCVSDRVIWDFLLSLTVRTINHNGLYLVCPRRYNHVLIVTNAAPTFLINHVFGNVIFFCLFLFICFFTYIYKSPLEFYHLVCFALSETKMLLLFEQPCWRNVDLSGVTFTPASAMCVLETIFKEKKSMIKTLVFMRSYTIFQDPFLGSTYKTCNHQTHIDS